MFMNVSITPSVIVKVSCYKSSGSILNIFRRHLEGVPNKNTIFQDWAQQCVVCCLLYLLWTSLPTSSQEAKGPISLSVNIADMCIPSQIIGDSDPKVLDTFDVFEDRSL